MIYGLSNLSYCGGCCSLTGSHSASVHSVAGSCSWLGSIPACPGGSRQSCRLSASGSDRLAKKIKINPAQQLKYLQTSPCQSPSQCSYCHTLCCLCFPPFTLCTKIILFSLRTQLEIAQNTQCCNNSNSWIDWG